MPHTSALRPGHPVHHVMLGVDVAGSSRPDRDDSLLPELRAAHTRLIAEALRRHGVTEGDYAVRSRGDGGRYDFRPEVSPVPVVEAVTGPLVRMLRRHNKLAAEGLRLSLRLVVHGGYLLPTADGGDADGADVNLLHGLLDAEELRTALADTAGPCVLAVSAPVWHGAIRHGHGEVEPAEFGPGILSVKGGASVPVWLTPAPPGGPGGGTATGAAAAGTANAAAGGAMEAAADPRPGQGTSPDAGADAGAETGGETAQAPPDGARTSPQPGHPAPGAGRGEGTGGITFNARVKAHNIVQGDQVNLR